MKFAGLCLFALLALSGCQSFLSAALNAEGIQLAAIAAKPAASDELQLELVDACDKLSVLSSKRARLAQKALAEGGALAARAPGKQSDDAQAALKKVCDLAGVKSPAPSGPAPMPAAAVPLPAAATGAPR